MLASDRYRCCSSTGAGFQSIDSFTSGQSDLSFAYVLDLRILPGLLTERYGLFIASLQFNGGNLPPQANFTAIEWHASNV
jgi:hypothetical protein